MIEGSGSLRFSRVQRAGSLVVGGVLVLLALGACAATPSHSAETQHRTTPSHTPSKPPTPTPTPTSTPAGFDRTAYSTDDPASIWVVANKQRSLDPVSFVPPDLVFPPLVNLNGQPMRQVTADALVAMFAAGKAEAGLDFSVQSGYRSYESQVRVYNADVAKNGQAYADTDTARPGHSEHQTGLAVDISAVPAKCSLAACFADTPQGRWLAANAWRFGFLLRYPADKVPVTGFTFEPWHFRFIGQPLAAEMHTRGITTLEEYFGIPGGEQYAAAQG